MSASTSPVSSSSTIAIPESAGRVMVDRIAKITPDIIRLLDEAREHGGSYINTHVINPVTGERLTVLIAGPEIEIA